MSTKFMLVGQIGAGKTTLFNRLFGIGGVARKTQVMEFEGRDGIDTPGEYFSHPRLYYALITQSADVERLVYVHPADVRECRLPPGLLSVYNDKRIDGVITKKDLPGVELETIERMLRAAGIGGRIFSVSRDDPTALAELRNYLLDDGDCATPEATCPSVN